MWTLLLGCTGTTTIIGGDAHDTGESAPLDTADSGPDSAEELPSPETLGKITFEPDGGSFVEVVTVSLSIEDGGGTLEYCLSDPSTTRCTWEPYVAPIQVTVSAIVRARVTLNAQSEIEGRSFVELEPELSTFESPIPVLIFWTDDSAPDSTSDVALGLTVYEPTDGVPTSLLSAPTDSGRARLHVRGSSSAGFEKKAFDMELWEADDDADRRTPLLGLPDNGDWVLYAPYYFDEALIRNPLAFTLSNAIGRYAPRTRMVEVFIAERGRAANEDDYLGVYVLIEEIEVDADRVAITPILATDVDEPELTGGYLFKIDRTGSGESGFYAGNAGGRFDFQQGFVAVEPAENELEREQQDYLQDHLDALGWAVDGLDGYEAILDVDSFIDHHILNLVMKNPDSFRLSGYMFQDRGGLLQAGPVWDFDRSAGSLDSRSFDPTWWDNQNETPDCTPVFTFGWYAGLFEDPTFSARYWERFEALLQAELSAEALDAAILTLATDLDEPAARDTARWNQAEFSGELAELRAWMADRHAWMSACIAVEPDPRTCRGR